MPRLRVWPFPPGMQCADRRGLRGSRCGTWPDVHINIQLARLTVADRNKPEFADIAVLPEYEHRAAIRSPTGSEPAVRAMRNLTRLTAG